MKNIAQRADIVGISNATQVCTDGHNWAINQYKWNHLMCMLENFQIMNHKLIHVLAIVN